MREWRRGTNDLVILLACSSENIATDPRDRGLLSTHLHVKDFAFDAMQQTSNVTNTSALIRGGILNTSPKVRLIIKDEIARFCTTADLAASVAFRKGPWHKQPTSKRVREALFRTGNG